MTVPESMTAPPVVKTDAEIGSFWPPTLIPVMSMSYKDEPWDTVDNVVNFTDFERPPLPKVRKPVELADEGKQ